MNNFRLLHPLERYFCLHSYAVIVGGEATPMSPFPHDFVQNYVKMCFKWKWRLSFGKKHNRKTLFMHTKVYSSAGFFLLIFEITDFQ